MIPLAPLDCKILALLDTNARSSFAALAKLLRVSPDTVLYHVEKLEKERVIDRYSLVIDLSRLGLQLFRISLRLRNSSDFEKRISSLLKSPMLSLIAETRGSHDAIVWGHARNLLEIQRFAEEVQQAFSRTFLSATIEVITETHAYSRGYLINRPGHIFPPRGDAEAVSLDRLELSLLEELSQNARTPHTDLAAKLDSTPAVVSYRMDKLENLGIVLGYRLHLNTERMGIQRFRAQLEPLTAWEGCRKLLTKFCAERPAITRFEQQLGAWPLEIGLEIDSFSAVHSTLDELREKTKGAVSVRGIDLFRKTYLPAKLSWIRLLKS